MSSVACSSSRPWPMPAICWLAATTRAPTNRAMPTSSPGLWPDTPRPPASISIWRRPSSVSPPPAARLPAWWCTMARHRSCGRPRANRQPDRRRAQAGLLASRQSLAGGRHGRVQRLQPRPQPGALPGPDRPYPATVPAPANRGRAGFLVWAAAGHALQRAADRPNPLRQPVAQYRPRYAGLDHGLRLRSRAGRHDERFAARPGCSLPEMLSDTHCHLDAAEFDADRDEVHAGAVAVGVEKIVVPAVAVDAFAGTRQTVARYV